MPRAPASKTSATGGRERSSTSRYRIMIPVVEPAHIEAVLPLAAAWLRYSTSLAEKTQGEVILVGAVTAPTGQNLSTGAAQARSLRAAMSDIRREHADLPLRIKPRVRVNHEPWQELLTTLSYERSQMLMLPWSGDPDEPILGASLAAILSQTACDLALVRPAQWHAIKNILLPIRGGPYTDLAVNFALALADAVNAKITVMHASQSGDFDQPYASYLPILRHVEQIDRQVTVVGDTAHAILREADRHEIIVMGASSRPGKIAPEPLGPVARQVTSATSRGLVLPRSPHAKLPPQPPAASASIATALPTLADKWFAENTFDASEFKDIGRMVERKQEVGLTISLALPALNEEETVGKVIRTVRQALMEKQPLLDEIVLIDSGSQDRTREIAQRLGIPVYIHQEILPEHKAYRGKGEALWKSLYVTRGDLIAWVDTDIVNIHPRFVYGILGPLLRSSRIKYVKGFYRRPLKVGDKLQAGGGGRVTELVARPLLNLFFPELSGLIQPLSGEYAGRRTALEQVPFFTGYGVETGLLIDLLNKFGMRSIAQVDLEERVHHNQPLEALSRMSFAIIQVIITRLEDRHKINLLEAVNRSMKLVRYQPGHYYLDVEEIGDLERPPMIEIPEYRKAFSITNL